MSSQAKHKDHYEDIIEERRSTSDLKYVLRTRMDLPVFKDRKPRTPTEIKADVLNSDRVKYRVEKVNILCIRYDLVQIWNWLYHQVSNIKNTL